MSVRARHIDIDPDSSVREFFRRLDVSGDSVTVVVEGKPVVVDFRPRPSNDLNNLTMEEKWEIAKSAMGGWDGLVDLDELERRIYESRDEDARLQRPPVELE